MRGTTRHNNGFGAMVVFPRFGGVVLLDSVLPN
jgi:hypothetical protein